MLPANKHFTIVIGIDVHFTTIPPFNPIHPFIGLVFDIGDYIPFLGSTTFVNGVPRGASDTSGMLVFLKHFPIATGPFALMPIIGDESTNFFGSLNTYAEGSRFTAAPYMEMTCNDIGIPLSFQPGKKFKPIPTLFAPTSFSIPLPFGAPVIVGGPYVPDWAAMLRNMIMGFGIGCLMKGMGKGLKKLGSKAKDALKDFNWNFLKKQPQSKWAANLSNIFCKFGFEPVNLVTGAVVYDGVDFELPGPVPLAWKRRWSSDSLWNGLLGHGCHSNFDMRLEHFPDYEAIAVTLSDGRPAAFVELLPGENDFNREEKLTLHHRGDSYELFDHEDRKSYIFPIEKDKQEHRLTEIRDESGHAIRLSYQSGRLTEVTDSAGRKLAVSTDRQGRITKVELCITLLEKETLVEYAYNENGDMDAITDAMGQTTRIVYQNHLMTSKTDRNGQTFYWEYDGAKSKSRCVHTWGDGGLLEGRIQYHKGYNMVTDSLGNVTRYDYLPDGRVTSVTDPLGAVSLTDYTPEGDILREIDAGGNITGYDYSEKGELTAITYPDGSRSSRRYDSDGKLQMETTPEGASTIYTYLKNGLLDKTISPDNQVTQYRYNRNNLITEISTSGGQRIQFSYDEQFNLTKAELPDGQVSEWKYDRKGQVIESHNASGGRSDYVYDHLGRIVKTVLPDGNSIRLTYNGYEEVVSAEDRERKVEFEYTPLGSLRIRRENGKTLRFGYNTEEQLTGLKNEAGESYTFGRDRAGRIVRETGFDGLTRNYERNPNGLVRRVERPGNRSSEYIYDNRGRLCGVEYHDGSFEQYSYNRDGLLVEARNNHSQLKITRDRQGRITEEWQDGQIVGSSYDKTTGRRNRVTSSLGADMAMAYTAGGQLQSMQAKDWGMHLTYDARGLEVERELTGGVTSRTEYDHTGRISRHTVTSNGREMRRHSYRWSHNDRLISIASELQQKETWFDYDTMGNLTGANYSRAEKLFRVPDAVGNLYRTKERNDRKYGAGGRLLESETTKYHYDEEGNLIAKVEDNKRLWRYQWNANGSLKEVIRPDYKCVEFEYDALGRRTAKIFDNRITRWLWDGNTPLHEWSYDEKERPKTITDEYGINSKDREEPVENLITWIFEEGTFKPAAKLTENGNYSIITDYLGTPAQIYDEKGELVWKMELDIYGKVRGFAGRALSDCPFRYQGQYEDTETGLYYNRHRYYDPEMGCYLSQDPIRLAGNNPTLYGYVHDPNSWVDVFGLDCSISKTIHDGSQGKHIPGHNNYIEGRSILSADAQTLLDNFHAGNINSSRVINDNKVKVNFGQTIGIHKSTDGIATPTSWGIIHSGKQGAHIVPALPDIGI
jgi:RHS repeat-associated protein